MARAAGKLAVAGRACHPHRWGRRRPEALDSNGAARLGRTMASPMIPPPAAPEFLARPGWADADILQLAGDPSFLRFFRLVPGDRTTVMLSAPPEHAAGLPFLALTPLLRGRSFPAQTGTAPSLGRVL